MKFKLKKVLASLLATALTFTTPLNAFASGGIGGSSADGNNAAGVVTSSGGDFSANISNGGNGSTSGKIGIRLSLVDPKDPSKVISVDNNGNPRVVDLLYVSKDTFRHQTEEMYWSNLYEAFTFNSVKTQPLMNLYNNPEQDIKRIYYPEINSWFTDREMPAWLWHNGSSYVSSGKEFAEWEKTNNYGQKLSDEAGGRLFYTVTVNGYAAPVKVYNYTDNEGNIGTVLESSGGGGYSANLAEFGSDTDALWVAYKDYLDLINVEKVKEVYNDYKKGGKTKTEALDDVAHDLADYALSAKGALAASELANNADLSAHVKAVDDALEYVYANAELNGEGVGPYLKEAANKFLAKLATRDNTEFTDTPNDEVQYAIQGTAGTAGTVDGNDDPNGSMIHIEQLLNIQEFDENGNPTGYHYLQTQSMIDSKDSETPLNIQTCTEDWVLLVEPIVWLTIFPNGTDAYPIHTKIYGTITNIVQAFNDPSVPANPRSLYDYRNTQTFNWKALNMPVWWALTVESTGFAFDADGENDLGYYYPDKVGQYRSFADLYSGLTNPVEKSVVITKKDGTQETQTRSCVEGWGVNCWWKGMFPEEPQPTTTPYPDDSGEGTTTHPIKLVKWYVNETRDSAGKVISQEVVNVKTGTIGKNIAIVNESVLGGDSIYEVKKWMTGKNASAIPREGDLKSTFEEYIKKSPGTMGGTEPAIIDLSNTPDEKVVYVKLVYQPVVPPPEETITVVKVKEPSDGSTPIIEKDVTSPGTYNGEDPGWDYKEDTQTPEPEVPVTKWPDVPTNGKPGNTPVIPIEPTTKTIYIRYTEDPNKGAQPEGGQIILYSNELSYGYTLRNLTKNNTLAAIQEYFDNHYRGSHRSV